MTKTTQRTAKILLFLFNILYLTPFVSAQSEDAQEPTTISFRTIGELGFLGVLDHKVQFSEAGTYFDYKRDGGQDVVFPFIRPSIEMTVGKQNTFILLYQPLRLESQVLLEDDLIVDELTFPANSNVNLLYNFPFFRFSYLREVRPEKDKFKLAFGGSLQLRNATISFESGDGTLFRSNRDTGPVPAIKIRSRYNFSHRVFAELEADGMYAPISYLNGSDNEVVGAILDASLRSGIHLNSSLTSFVNMRYLAGGAVGTSDDDPGPGDGYTRNWLHFMTVSTGFIYHFESATSK